MSNETVTFGTFEEIKKEPNLSKVIVIGNGGQGKTKLVNMLTGADFKTSTSTADGTFDFQGALLKQNRNILIVDSPGYRLNEDRWWNGMMEIEKKIGFIVMHTYELRNSGYGHFGYVLQFLEKNNTKVKKFLMDHQTNVETENYMSRSVLANRSNLNLVCSQVQEWISHLDGQAIEICSPIDLLQQYQNKMNELDELKKLIRQLQANHEEAISNKMCIIKDLERQVEQLTDDEKTLERIIDTLPGELASYDDNSTGFLPDAPHWSHYLYSWLPGVGIIHLNSLRTKAEKDHKIAIKLISVKKKDKKK